MNELVLLTRTLARAGCMLARCRYSEQDMAKECFEVLAQISGLPAGECSCTTQEGRVVVHFDPACPMHALFTARAAVSATPDDPQR